MIEFYTLNIKNLMI